MSTHPWYAKKSNDWRRYRAFTSNISDVNVRKTWLPKGPGEPDENYNFRAMLTEEQGWSGPAVDRMAGRLELATAEPIYGEDAIDISIKEEIEQFRSDVNGENQTLVDYWSEHLPDILAMGIGFTEVTRKYVPNPQTKADEGKIVVVYWTAEDVVDWGVDQYDTLDWVRIEWEEISSTNYESDSVLVRKRRILTKTTGEDFIFSINKESKDTQTNEQWVSLRKWEHKLGRVPLVPMYARKVGTMQGSSYVHLISCADLVAFRLQSDQLHCSWLHGNPILKVHRHSEASNTSAVNIGISRYQHLNPGSSQGLNSEDMSYVTFDAGGMDMREQIIARVQAQALQASGIDPSLVKKGGEYRSGVSIAWSFSTAEEPILSKFMRNMDNADVGILELVYRYLSSEDFSENTSKVWNGSITRSRNWHSDTIESIIAEVIDVKEVLVSSKTAQKIQDTKLALRACEGIHPTTLDVVKNEIEQFYKDLDNDEKKDIERE